MSVLRRGASGAARVLHQAMSANALRQTGIRAMSSVAVTDKLNPAPAAITRNYDHKYATAGSVALLSAVAAAATVAVADDTTLAEKAVVYPVKTGFKDVVLYQYDVCPFCNKVKAFLDFHKIPYRVVEVNPLFKGELKWSEYQKVPVLMVNGEQLNDSTHIITTLSERIAEMEPPEKKGWFAKKTIKPTAAALEEEQQWREWVDSRFVHVLTPNLYRTTEEAWQAFDYITESGNFNFVERQAARVAGAVMMYVISKMILKKRHNIDDERTALYEACDEWVAAVGKDRPFLGGSTPNNADISVWGVLHAVEGMDTFKDVMDNTTIKPWFERMTVAVGGSTRMYD
mmetsp:Transcript_39367/g.47729  ORF Transcript_39367/g.47729 Transcript_39367/m.47729 type:complete len:343 (-) Transcript_39367:481-1509(-)|eukprot:CAMPEP_0197851904 /NCGR_PEP_ID=MMETSP1438-20131217/19185_1 /TAXON_ID=1461541 /ORGANISM="Pterosperma sp., Strain CCMP1384" /LENGTH=342 /DNA_ID=CAMNT_0043465695 /DNA_START=96 /DNA_END=1124 /DNA_ORIENTATION=+